MLDMVEDYDSNRRSYRSQEIPIPPSNKAATGECDRGVALSKIQSATYVKNLTHSRDQWWFVFYDTADNRGWFVDGASALLHLVRKSLAVYQNDPDNGSRYRFDLKERESVGNRSNRSYGILTDIENREQILRDDFPESFQDQVESIWSKLEWAIAEQEFLNTHHRNLFGQIQGFQFVDIAENPCHFRVCAAKLEPAKITWLNLTRMPESNTALLFGRRFGELIQPSENAVDALCPYWQALPKGEGYLAARWYDILVSLKSKRYSDGILHSGSTSCRWFAPKHSTSPTSPHKPGESRCCEKAHVILPNDVARSMEDGVFTCPPKLKDCPNGAIIFGLSPHCPSYWEDARNETRCCESPTIEETSETQSATFRQSPPTTPRANDEDTASQQCGDVHPDEEGTQKAGRQAWTMERPLFTLGNIKNLSTFLPSCARLLMALVCMTGFFAPLIPGDSLCATVRWFSCCILGSWHFFLSTRGWRFESRLLSMAEIVAFLLLLSWCIILTPVQILFTTPLEHWKMPPNYTFVPYHIKYQPSLLGGIDAE